MKMLIHRAGAALTCLGLLVCGAVVLAGEAEPERSYADAWGPAIGTPLPPLRAQDQTGTWRDFDSLKGKKGLLLFMNRSADW